MTVTEICDVLCEYLREEIGAEAELVSVSVTLSSRYSAHAGERSESYDLWFGTPFKSVEILVETDLPTAAACLARGIQLIEHQIKPGRKPEGAKA